MKEKQFEPGKQNNSSPTPGLAAVNTHNPDEESLSQTYSKQQQNSLEKDENEDFEREDRTKRPE